MVEKIEKIWYAIRLPNNKWYDFEHDCVAGLFRSTCLCIGKEAAIKRAKYRGGEIVEFQVTEIKAQLDEE